MHRLTRMPFSVLLTTVLGLGGFLGLGVPGATAQDRRILTGSAWLLLAQVTRAIPESIPRRVQFRSAVVIDRPMTSSPEMK